jgi:1-aminocyclopropane-1-carboxylate deaminase
MVIIHEANAVIQPIGADWYGQRVAEVDMLRLDLLHPVVSGNKWFKLKYNLANALATGYDTIVTFGGAYSNHLVATAAAASVSGFRSVGFVRGTNAAASPSPVLAHCRSLGMELQFISREEYAQKDQPDYIGSLSEKLGSFFLIPEGGANDAGRKGAEDIAGLIPPDYTHVCLAVGTGTTLIGLRSALPGSVELIGFVPMKQGAYLEDTIRQFLSPGNERNWQLTDSFHFGGFGKYDHDLVRFMNGFYQSHLIPLDIVYTSKMMFGLQQLIAQGFFPPQARILCIHSGGLTGNVSVKEQLVFPVSL